MGGRRVIQLPAKMKSSPMPVPPSGGPFDTGEEGGAGGEHVRRLAVRANSSEGFFNETGGESRAGGEWGWGSGGEPTEGEGDRPGSGDIGELELFDLPDADAGEDVAGDRADGEDAAMAVGQGTAGPWA